LEAFMDLASERLVGEVLAGEDRAGGAAEFFERLVGGVLGAAAGEAAQDLLGFGGAELERGGVLDELVVLRAMRVQSSGRAETIGESSGQSGSFGRPGR
jgi:hypothetical protein